MERLGFLIRSAMVVALFGGAVGCAAAPAAQMQKDIGVMQRESAPERLEARGEAYAAVGDVTRAEQYFVASMKVGGDSARLTRRLVASCVSDGRYPAALDYAEEHLRRHPGDLDVRYVAGTLRLAVGDRDGARAAMKQVVAIAPDFAEAHFTLAQIAREQGDFGAADAQYREYLRVSPEGENAEIARAGLLRSVQ